MKDTKRLMGKQALGEKWAECGFALKGKGGRGGGIICPCIYVNKNASTSQYLSGEGILFHQGGEKRTS